jgi:hypothetical protein
MTHALHKKLTKALSEDDFQLRIIFVSFIFTNCFSFLFFCVSCSLYWQNIFIHLAMKLLNENFFCNQTGGEKNKQKLEGIITERIEVAGWIEVS